MQEYASNKNVCRCFLLEGFLKYSVKDVKVNVVLFVSGLVHVVYVNNNK